MPICLDQSLNLTLCEFVFLHCSMSIGFDPTNTLFVDLFPSCVRFSLLPTICSLSCRPSCRSPTRSMAMFVISIAHTMTLTLASILSRFGEIPSLSHTHTDILVDVSSLLSSPRSLQAHNHAHTCNCRRSQSVHRCCTSSRVLLLTQTLSTSIALERDRRRRKETWMHSQ